MKIWFLVVLAALPSAIAAPAEKPARHVRFLALGDSPPFRQEIRDGVRYELEPPAGSIPPRNVTLSTDAKATEPVSLRLGDISAPVKVPGGAGPLDIRRADVAADAEPWLKVTRPADGDFLVLLWRDPKVGTWAAVRSMVLPDDAVNAPAGMVRFVNVSPAAVGVTLGEEKLVLGPGKSFARQIEFGVERPFEIMLTTSDGSLKRLHSGVAMLNPGERGLAFVYQADGVARRLPLKVIVKREPAPPPPPPVPKP
jgi:hypothetical protein